MAGLHNSMFNPNKVHMRGGGRHRWCMVTAILQYTSLSWIYPLQTCFIVGLHALFIDGAILDKVCHRVKAYLYFLLVLVVIHVIFTSLHIILAVQVHGMYPSMGDFCSIYMVTTDSFINVTWLIMQILLHFLGLIVSIVLRIFIFISQKRSDEQFNTVGTRRIGNDFSRDNINLVFVKECLLPWLYGLPIIIVCIITLSGVTCPPMLQWSFTVILLPIWTVYTPRLFILLLS